MTTRRNGPEMGRGRARADAKDDDDDADEDDDHSNNDDDDEVEDDVSGGETCRAVLRGNFCWVPF